MSKKRGTNVPDQPTVPPMPKRRRYIDESILVEKLHVGEGLPTISRSVLVNCVLPTIPTADVRENVRGHWELKTDGFGGLSDNVTAWANYCSVCGYHYGTPYNFCPNCGAEMENSLAMNKKTKAEWICLGHRMGFCKHPYSVDYKCSNCGYEEYTLLSSPPDKCPNCGAEMQGEGR